MEPPCLEPAPLSPSASDSDREEEDEEEEVMIQCANHEPGARIETNHKTVYVSSRGGGRMRLC